MWLYFILKKDLHTVIPFIHFFLITTFRSKDLRPDNSILYTAYFILPIKLQYSQVYLRPFTIYKSIYSTDFLPKSEPKMKKTSKIRLRLIMTVWCSTSRLICWQKPQWFLCGRIRACLHIYSTVIFSCAGVYVLPRWLRVGDGQFM